MLTENGRRRREILKGIVGSKVAISGLGTGQAVGQSTDNEQLYIVLAGGSGLRDKLRKKGCKILHEIAEGSVIIASGPTKHENELRSLPVVSDVVPNRTMAAEEIQRTRGSGEASSGRFSERQWDKHLIDAFNIHDVATGAGTSLAVIDTGVTHSHPDLAPNIDTESSRVIHNGKFDSGKKSINVLKDPTGFIPITKAVELPVASDVDGHGSRVAGIAAASRNGNGFTGVAPDTTVVPLRIGSYHKNSDGSSELQLTLADFLLAIDYAVEIGVDVANISLVLGPLSAGTERRRYFAAFRRLIQYAIEQGTVVVVAGGNEGMSLEENPLHVLPSTNRGVISVASTGPNDHRYYNSNYGGEVIDVAAPGGGYETVEKTYSSDGVEWPYPTNQVLSTVPETIYGHQYEYDRGTSMAAPQVAGLACLIRELKPDLHPRRVKQAIERGAVNAAGSDASELGAGRISVANSVDRLSE